MKRTKVFSMGRWAIFVFGLGLWPLSAARAETLTIDSYNSHGTWQAAATLPDLHQGVVAYGELVGLGSGRFYRLAIKQPMTVAIELANPKAVPEKFTPQVVIFQPEPETIGPVLPIEQPPNTLALVYRSDIRQDVYDAATQTSYRRRFLEDIKLPIAGTYYFGVYNTDGANGRFRLALGVDELPRFGPETWLSHWWRAQTWAGVSLSTLFLPLVLLTLISLAIWRSWLLIQVPAKPQRKKKAS